MGLQVMSDGCDFAICIKSAQLSGFLIESFHWLRVILKGIQSFPNGFLVII